MSDRTQVTAVVGIGAVAVALAERLAFFTWEGFVLLVVGFALVALGAFLRNPEGVSNSVAYPILFITLGVAAAAVSFIPDDNDPWLTVLTGGAVAAFVGLGMFRQLRRAALPIAATLLIAAHATVILKVPFPPHQDVFRFLNYGVDALAGGRNPYGLPIGADGQPFKLTYPPGALLLLTPFRVILGDIRWAYVAAEGLVVAVMSALVLQRSSRPRLLGSPGRAEGPGKPHARRLELNRGEAALLLVPLALPRVGQAFFVFSNPEWVLLALAAVALAWRSSWVGAGLVLGVGIATKQYFIVFPAIFLWRAIPIRAYAAGLLVAVALCLPFLIWDSSAFLGNVFGNLAGAPDPERLTLWAAASHMGIGTGRAFSVALFALGAVAVAVAWWLTRRRPLSVALVACGLSLAAFSLCASFAAYNYYAYALVFCTWGLLLPPDWERRARLS